jgi:uncharacterized protein (TIGR01777 family)
MKIAISGANGFVGKHLQELFSDAEIISITREKLSLPDSEFRDFLEGSDAVFNLAGAPIIKRWSEDYKKTLYSSRIETTKKITSAINSMEVKPKLLISTSAVGIYANSQVCSEDEFKYADDFLSKLCQDWESEALKAQTRVAIFRFGIVLGRDGGALKQMLTPFKLGLGGNIGSGEQGFSFIHIDDLVNAYKFILESESLEGVFNLGADEPTTNAGLTKALSKALHRPAFLPVPEFVLNMIFGEGARVLTDGQQMVPKRLLEAGFEFKYKNIAEVIEACV